MPCGQDFVCFSRLGKLGKLGNQLFQIATTIALAEKHSVQAKFPEWNYAAFFQGPFDQTLSTSDIAAEYIERNPHYEPVPFKRNLDLFGFFQCEKYFSDAEHKIRQAFSFRDEVLPPEWLNVRGDCAVHVRRADYLIKSHRFVPLEQDYYLKAIEMMRQKGCRNFLVFSDDAQWCQQHLPQDVVVVSGLSDIQSLCLMSRCSNHIIANSTFSWWSSWLCENTSKVIIAPRTWYGFQYSFRKNTNYQYCDNWTLLSNELHLHRQVACLIKSTTKRVFFLPKISRRLFLQAAVDIEEEQKRALESSDAGI